MVEVPPLEGEAILENNQVPFEVASRKKKIRVIYMEGSTNNESHYVRDALVEDPNIECLVMEVDDQYLARPRLFRVNDRGRGYPTTREELFGYDVVICSDISRSAFTQEQLNWTAELVGQRGGGFAMVGGNTSFGAGFWDQTVWDGLIPVIMSGSASSVSRGILGNIQFKVKVPQEVERHPIWRIVEDPVQNRAILEQMPPFLGTNLIARLKPAATALGYTDRPLSNVGIMPVFACEPFGRGRTFAMSTDTTWLWGDRFEKIWGEQGDNRYFRKFWRNVVQWLAENSAGANRRLRAASDKVIYRPGQPIKVSARAFDEKLEETDRYRVVVRLRPVPAVGTGTPPALQEVLLSPPTEGRSYEGELTTPPLRQLPVPGNPLLTQRLLMLEVAALDQGRPVAETNLEVQVLDDSTEFADPQPDSQRLEELARETGGKVLHRVEDLAQLLSPQKSTPGEVVVQKVPAWDRSLLWLVLLGLLTADWALRRWAGLA